MTKGKQRRERRGQFEAKRSAHFVLMPMGQSVVNSEGHYASSFDFDEHGNWAKTREQFTPHGGETVDLLKKE